MNKQCQNCKTNFEITQDDLNFYNRIQVPPPTWCPECRLARRMSFYSNIFARLYKRKCDATGKHLISIYSPSHKVYERSYWYSDNWDPLSYGFEYDFSISFFEQFNKLQRSVPRYHTYNHNSINCEYCAAITNSKDCYLSTGAENKNCYYSGGAFKSNNCIDCWFIIQCDSCYNCINSEKCFRVAFSQYVNSCMESVFLYDCSNCSYCFGCINLRNKSYHIFNKPYSKKEYFRILRDYNLGSFLQLIKFGQEFSNFKLSSPIRFAKIFSSVNVSGDNIRHTKNCHNCFNTLGVENCRHTTFAGLRLSESYDVFDASVNSSLLYEAGGAGHNLYKSSFLNWVIEGSDVHYSDLCENSSNLFACVGLRNKQYCILNKQYTPERYKELVESIKEHMDKMPYISRKSEARNQKFETPKQNKFATGQANSKSQIQNSKTREIIYRYGEFFPPELSPFAYNETIAQEYFPLTKEQALEKGYNWKEPEERNIVPDIKTEDLPDHIKDVKDDIVDKIIQCAHANLWTSDVHRLESGCNEQCATAFKIIQPELDFYRKMNLPLSRLCPNCRHYQRLKQRNPLKLWHRKCMCAGTNSQPTTNNPQQPNYQYQNTIEHFHKAEPCPNEFETTYAPERPEIVYWERCYQQEVV